MNKVLLYIKTKGYQISIPGLSEFRSPGTIDISKVDLSNVVIQLSKMGVDFVIQTNPKIKNANKFNIIPIGEENKNVSQGNNEELKSLRNFIETEFYVLRQLIGKQSFIGNRVDVKDLDLIGKVYEENEEDDNEFIPSISIESYGEQTIDLKSEGKSVTTGDINDSINKLKNIGK